MIAAAARAALCLSLLLFGAVAGTAFVLAQEVGSEDVSESINQTYRLAAGDRLRINVFGHPDVSGEFDVDGTGKITFPLLGPVEAGGKTIEELRQRVQEDLNRDYLVDPRVTVEVLNFRPIYILGQVNTPGQYPYSVGLNVRQAVALAGGYTRRARTSSMKLIRTADGQSTEMEAEESTLVLPGDTIEIERRFF